MGFLTEAAVLLGAAILAVPLFQRLGLGSILGYLCIGLLAGPSISGFISEPESVLHFSEFGVVMLLFISGLELEPRRLWGMRKRLLGLGTLQMAGCAALLMPVGLLLDLPPSIAIFLGLTLALSSTAFAFQDLAVIPLLALLPFLAGRADAAPGDGWLIARSIGVVIAAIVFGRLVFPRVLALIARSDVHEIFTAAALFLVLAMALVMEWAGLSMALGAFLGGVMLADTPYRHELEANIEPFKGLLLGLFFIAVGMSVNLGLVLDNVWLVLGLAVAMTLAKSVVLVIVGLLARLPRPEIPRLATIISQGGEFDFVLLTAAVAAGVIDQRIASLCIAAVTLSMAATPFLYQLGEKAGDRLKESRPFDTDFGDDTPPVIIAGLGRFGQMVGRMLKMQGINFTALDPNITQVEFIRRFGSRIFYADATRLDLLRAAGIDKAQLLVIAVDGENTALTIARLAKTHFPDLAVYARARNRHHAWQLMEIGVDGVVRETFASSMEMSVEVLKGLGYPSANAINAVRTFRDFDNQLLKDTYAHRNDTEQLMATEKAAMAELQSLFQQELNRGRTGRREEDTDTDDREEMRDDADTIAETETPARGA